ncbi:MAG: hypothetical protein WCO86_06760 [Planctomycetota bacterium]
MSVWFVLQEVFSLHAIGTAYTSRDFDPVVAGFVRIRCLARPEASRIRLQRNV